MAEDQSPNQLVVLMKERGGIISIEEAHQLLGLEAYTRCLTELWEKGEDDPEHAALYYLNGDGDKPDGKPTHIVFSEEVFKRFCDMLDDALEKEGQLSPRTKGFTVN